MDGQALLDGSSHAGGSVGSRGKGPSRRSGGRACTGWYSVTATDWVRRLRETSKSAPARWVGRERRRSPESIGSRLRRGAAGGEVYNVGLVSLAIMAEGPSRRVRGFVHAEKSVRILTFIASEQDRPTVAAPGGVQWGKYQELHRSFPRVFI